MPLLYDSIVIRSTGQSHALQDVFHENPAFVMYVKKVCLEGAYSSMDKVLGCCENLTTLVVLLHVFSDASIGGFCRALPMIKPKMVILRNEWEIDNVKIRTVFNLLCKAIPT